jgi:hypothetical protein
MSTPQEKCSKLTYRTPGFVVYGEIRAITQSSTMTGPPDGGHGNDKTT